MKRTPQQIGRQNRRVGDITQQATIGELRRQGAKCLQEIASPCVVLNGRKLYTAKVVGDISGVWPGGRAILCECKTRSYGGHHRRPRPSDFEPHQRAALLEMDAAGGSALVAYLFNGQLLIEPALNFFQEELEQRTKPCPICQQLGRTERLRPKEQCRICGHRMGEV